MNPEIKCLNIKKKNGFISKQLYIVDDPTNSMSVNLQLLYKQRNIKRK